MVNANYMPNGTFLITQNAVFNDILWVSPLCSCHHSFPRMEGPLHTGAINHRRNVLTEPTLQEKCTLFHKTLKSNFSRLIYVLLFILNYCSRHSLFVLLGVRGMGKTKYMYFYFKIFLFLPLWYKMGSTI